MAQIRLVETSDNSISPYHSRQTVANLSLRTPEDFYAAAEAMLPILAQRAHLTEAERQVPDATIEDFISSGILEMMRPKRFGGAELDFSVMMEVSAILARSCTASSWVSIVYASHLWILSMMSEEAQVEIFGESSVVLAPGVFNGVGAKTRAVTGGYMLSGRWAFGSGSIHSNWAFVGATIEREEGTPEGVIMAIPREQYEVLDTWNATGLRGTGSNDISVGEEIFVPEHRIVATIDLLEGTGPGGAINGPGSRLPALAAFNLAAGAPAIGIARHAIALFKDKIASRVRSFSGAEQKDSPAAHIRLARAQTDVDAAELILIATIRDLEAEVIAGRQPTGELRAKCRMVSGYAPQLCKEAVMSVVEASGAKVMFDGETMGRLLRDAAMISSHHTLDYDGGTQNYGRVLIGLPPINPMT